MFKFELTLKIIGSFIPIDSTKLIIEYKHRTNAFSKKKAKKKNKKMRGVEWENHGLLKLGGTNFRYGCTFKVGPINQCGQWN